MLEFLLLVVIVDVILIVLVPENVWLTIHRSVRAWWTRTAAWFKTLG